MKYLEIADDLRRRLDAGEFPVGSVISGGYLGLREHYSATQNVVREALAILEMEGRIQPIRKRGIVVLDPQVSPQRLDRGRLVFRDHLGYYFNRLSGHWSPVRTPTREWAPAPADIAAILGVGADEEVLIRYRVLGPNPSTPLQIAASYLPADIARGTVLEEAHTGPGGIYDRLEHDMGHGPLEWSEEVSARSPDRDEASDLKISRNVPLLVFTRTAESGTVQGKILEVNQTLMSAARFKVAHTIERDETALWPTSPATHENPPKAS